VPQVDITPSWYMVTTFNGREEDVKKRIEMRVKNSDLSAFVSSVVIPTEKILELKGGQRSLATKKIFPGYLLVKMYMNLSAFRLVRETPGILGFVGANRKPQPLTDAEVNNLMARMNSAPHEETIYKKGDTVRVIEGPFTDMVATVERVLEGKGRLVIKMIIFGKDTDTELDSLQVEKL
jgi:transcriptional antiterminator NusG